MQWFSTRIFFKKSTFQTSLFETRQWWGYYIDLAYKAISFKYPSFDPKSYLRWRQLSQLFRSFYKGTVVERVCQQVRIWEHSTPFSMLRFLRCWYSQLECCTHVYIFGNDYTWPNDKKAFTINFPLFIYLFTYLFIHLFIYLFIYSFIYLFVYLFIYLFIYSPVNLFPISLLHNPQKSRFHSIQPLLFYCCHNQFNTKSWFTCPIQANFLLLLQRIL